MEAEVGKSKSHPSSTAISHNMHFRINFHTTIQSKRVCRSPYFHSQMHKCLFPTIQNFHQVTEFSNNCFLMSWPVAVRPSMPFSTRDSAIRFILEVSIYRSNFFFIAAYAVRFNTFINSRVTIYQVSLLGLLTGIVQYHFSFQ